MTRREIKFRSWNGDTTLGYKQHGYQMRKADWHPNCNKRGYVMEHRLVMERYMGEYLPKHAIIHHKNGVRNDNRLDNLEYMPEQERHAKHHDTGKRNPNGQFVAQDPTFSEIKFRLLNKNTGMMQVMSLQKLISTTFRRSQFEFRGRSTGLKDKNGREIYDGDILETTYVNSPIEVVEFKLHIGTEFGKNVFGYNEDYEKFKIIGNIYKNPELLEE